MKKLIALVTGLVATVSIIGHEVRQMHVEILNNHKQEMQQIRAYHIQEMQELKKIEVEQDSKIFEANKQLFHDVQQKIKEQLGK